MCLNYFIKNKTVLNLAKSSGKKNSQKGSALVIAIFIIVVMSLLGAALMRMLSTGANTIAYEVLGTRAFQAAQTGQQWKLQDVFPLDGQDPGNCPEVPEEDPPSLNADGLNGCVITINCSKTLPIQGVVYYTINSTGTCTSAGVTTSRIVEVQARDIQ